MWLDCDSSGWRVCMGEMMKAKALFAKERSSDFSFKRDMKLGWFSAGT